MVERDAIFANRLRNAAQVLPLCCAIVEFAKVISRISGLEPGTGGTSKEDRKHPLLSQARISLDAQLGVFGQAHINGIREFWNKVDQIDVERLTA